jgi:hypothetical protein
MFRNVPLIKDTEGQSLRTDDVSGEVSGSLITSVLTAQCSLATPAYNYRLDSDCPHIPHVSERKDTESKGIILKH